MSAPAFEFIHPGDLATRTGGYGYARELLAALGDRGVDARLHRLADSFPFPDAAALTEAGAVLASIPTSSTVVVDGLAFGVMAPVAVLHARRLRLVALVHHPLALETGLDAITADRLMASERAALASACAVVVTSLSTAAALSNYGVAPSRITVVLPGTQRPRTMKTSQISAGIKSQTSAGNATAVRLLCVASITPRKGHEDLIEALAALTLRQPRLAWHLRCIGSLERDRDCVARLRSRIAQLGLVERVTLEGECDDAEVDRAYAAADLFVLASHHEGYGMVLAEAVSYGLPLVSTTAGAIAQTVPAGAALLVPAGDVAALSDALEQAIARPDLREKLAVAAREAAAGLPDWDDAAARFESMLRSLAPAPLVAGAAR